MCPVLVSTAGALAASKQGVRLQALFPVVLPVVLGKRSQQKLFREWDYLPDSLLEEDWKQNGEDKLF